MWILARVGAVLGLAAAFGVAVSGTSGTGTTGVTIADNAFAPADLTVQVGTTVIWTHQGADTHTVTADSGSFNSGSDPSEWLEAGDQYSVNFGQPGTFAYYCLIHGGPGGTGMSGTITVAQQNTPTPTPAPTAPPTEPPVTPPPEITPTPVAPTPTQGTSTPTPTPSGSVTPGPTRPQTPVPPGSRTFTPTPFPTFVPLEPEGEDDGGGIPAVIIVVPLLMLLVGGGVTGFLFWRDRQGRRY
jgi:plastocyanin